MVLELPVQNSKLLAIPEQKSGPMTPDYLEFKICISQKHDFTLLNMYFKLTRNKGDEDEDILADDQSLSFNQMAFGFDAHQTIEGAHKSA